MRSTCDCGMTLEQHHRRGGCPECGTACCPSCSVEIEATKYCRWCAPGLAPAASR